MGDSMTLAEEFAAARIEASNTARFTAASCPPKTCRYCGKHWTRWPGSKLDGHSKCIVPVTFQDRLAAIPSTTKGGQAIAAELGVTYSVYRSWTCPISMRRRAA